MLFRSVIASRAASHALNEKRAVSDLPIPPWDEGTAKIANDDRAIISHAWDEIRRLMWYYVGIIRSERRLKCALGRIINIKQELDNYYWDFQVDRDLLEVRNLAEIAHLTIRCAMARKESRGIHYTIDHPQPLPNHSIKDTVIW